MDHSGNSSRIYSDLHHVFNTRQELSEMLQVVVNNQFSDWLKPTRLLKIFLSLAAPAAKRRARGSGRILGARAPLASAPPAKPLAVCRFPHVSH